MNERATAYASVPGITPTATGQRKDTTKNSWLELAVNGIYRRGSLQAIRGAGGEGNDCGVEQSSAEALFAIQSAHKFLVLF